MEQDWLSAPRFFVADRVEPGATAVRVTGDEAHHGLRVLRLGIGQAVVVLDGSGMEYRGTIETVRGGGAPEFAVRVVAALSSPAEPDLFVHLVQGIPKGDKLEYVLQKGTEVGVSAFWPVWTERVLVLFGGDKAEARRARWQRIAAEAAKQSRRAILPAVSAPAGLFDVARELREGGVELLVLWERATTPLREALRSLGRRGARDARPAVALVVGPEGGLTPQEVEGLEALGARCATLGPRILRSETAGPVAAALVLYEFEEANHR